MSSIFELYPEAKTVAIAGLYGMPFKQDSFQLSEYISIVPANECIESVYLPRISKYAFKPSHYFVAIANDNRYWSTSRKLENRRDALSSITLAHLTLCLYHKIPYSLGPIYGFNSEGAPVALNLSTPRTAGIHSELKEEILSPAVSPIASLSVLNRGIFNNSLKIFFEKLAIAYSEVTDKRWIFAAFKYLSGITQYYAQDAVIDFSVSIEALVNRGEQVSFSTRLYMSLLVGHNYAERKKIVSDIREFYKLRNTIVHGSTFNISEQNKELIIKIRSYLADALIATCGKRIEKDVFPELEYMCLIGAPSHSRERICNTITIDEIVNEIKNIEKIQEFDSYEVCLSEMDEDGDQDVFIQLKKGQEVIETFDVSMYIWQLSLVEGLSRYSYWLSQDETGNYVYHISYIKDDNGV